MRTLSIAEPTTVHELADVVEAAFRIFVPPPLTQLEIRVVDDHSYEVWIKRCYIHENVTKAGIAVLYDCAAGDRLQGWHDVLGLPLVEEPQPRPCPKVQGRECRAVLSFQPPKP